MISRPTVVTSGFIAVDVILNDQLRASTGGTATNVARSLASLGWQSRLVGTIGDDPAGNFAHDEFIKAGVDVTNLVLSPLWTTPVVLQEEYRGDHIWRFSCPYCHARFAKHRPSPEDFADKLIASLDTPTVFLFDRVSRFTLALAEVWSGRGTLVVFEPATLGHERLFDRAAKVADLVKFSSERAPAFESHLVQAAGSIVETLGARGARVKIAGTDVWQNLPSQRVADLVDSAGAGDWTTAGLIDSWVRQDMSVEKLLGAVDDGQALGARACSWEGVHPDGPQKVDSDFERFACPRVATLDRVRVDVSALR